MNQGLDSLLLAEVMARDGRRKPGEEVSTAEALTEPCGYNSA